MKRSVGPALPGARLCSKRAARPSVWTAANAPHAVRLARIQGPSQIRWDTDGSRDRGSGSGGQSCGRCPIQRAQLESSEDDSHLYICWCLERPRTAQQDPIRRRQKPPLMGGFRIPPIEWNPSELEKTRIYRNLLSGIVIRRAING